MQFKYNYFLIESIFGNRPEKAPSKPNTIYVPPKDEEQKSKQETKVEEPTIPPVKPELNALDSTEFFNSLKSDPVKSNEYNPPNLFAGMSLGVSTASKPTSVFGIGAPPSQSTNVPIQLNTSSTSSQNSLFGLNMQTTPNSVFPNTSTNLFGVPLTNQNQSSDKKSIFQESQNQKNLNNSVDFSNTQDSNIFSFEGMNITQPDNANKSMIQTEDKGDMDKSSEYNPPSLFNWLSGTTQNDPKVVNKAEVVESPSQNTSSTSGKFWDSYKKTGGQPEVAKTVSQSTQIKSNEKVNSSTVAPHTPENKK